MCLRCIQALNRRSLWEQGPQVRFTRRGSVRTATRQTFRLTTPTMVEDGDVILLPTVSSVATRHRHLIRLRRSRNPQISSKCRSSLTSLPTCSIVQIIRIFICSAQRKNTEFNQCFFFKKLFTTRQYFSKNSLVVSFWAYLQMAHHCIRLLHMSHRLHHHLDL